MLYLDGIHFRVRHGDQADSTLILTALDVDGAGNKEVLALRACAEESKEGWISVLEDIRRRAGVDYVEMVFCASAHCSISTPLRPRWRLLSILTLSQMEE